MVSRVKGAGRAPPTLTSQGWFFHHDGIYARNWTLPLCAYSVVWTFYCILDACRPVWSTCKPPLHVVVCDEFVNIHFTVLNLSESTVCYEMVKMYLCVLYIMYLLGDDLLSWHSLQSFLVMLNWNVKHPFYSGVWGICRLKVLVLFGIQWTCTLTIFPYGFWGEKRHGSLRELALHALSDLGDAVVRLAISWEAPARTTRTEHAEILPLLSLSPSKLGKTPVRVSTLAFGLCGCEHYTFWPMWAAWTCIHSWALSYLVGSFEGYKNPYSNSEAAPQEVLYSIFNI